MSTETGRMRSHLRRTLPLAAGLVAIGALSGGGLVWAHGNATEISACVEPRTGYLVYGRSCGGEQHRVEPAGPGRARRDSGTGRAPGSARARRAPRARASRHRRSRDPAPQPPSEGSEGSAGQARSRRAREAQAQPRRRRSVGLSSFHDRTSLLTSLKTAFDPKGVAHLDVPAGKYVIFAKAYGYAYPEDYDSRIRALHSRRGRGHGHLRHERRQHSGADGRPRLRGAWTDRTSMRRFWHLF